MKTKTVPKTTSDLLTIPDFLRRKKRRGRPPKIEPVLSGGIFEPDLDKYVKWDRIKQAKFGPRYNIILGDEAPRIGSGFRTVYVKEGRKWAVMTSHEGDPEDKESRVVKKRFPLKVWHLMKASHERYLKRNDPIEVAKRRSRKRYRKPHRGDQNV